MKRSIVVVLDVDDIAHDGNPISDPDLAAGVRARLDEFYPTDVDVLTTENVRVSVMNPDAVTVFLDATDVGLEGAQDNGANELDVVHAGQIVDDLRGTHT